MTLQQWVVIFLIFFGVFFMLVAAVGLNRMPDLYMRMHGATKSTTLGIIAIISATALYFGTSVSTTRAILVILFFFITAPIATHVLARAAYRRNVPRWQGTIVDQLADSYEQPAAAEDGANGELELE